MILLVSSHTSQNQAIMRACAQRGRQDVQVINLADFPMSMDLMMAFSSGKQGTGAYRKIKRPFAPPPLPTWQPSYTTTRARPRRPTGCEGDAPLALLKGTWPRTPV